MDAEKKIPLEQFANGFLGFIAVLAGVCTIYLFFYPLFPEGARNFIQGVVRLILRW